MRCGREWEMFMDKHGASWDEFSEDAKALAVSLAEKQGERLAQILKTK